MKKFTGSLVLHSDDSLPAGVDLSAVTSLVLCGSSTLPAGVDLSAVTSLKMYGSSTLPAGVDLSAVTRLKMYGSSTLPAGVDLSAVTSLGLYGSATLPEGVDLSAVTSLGLYDSSTLPAGVKLPNAILADVPVLPQIDQVILQAIEAGGGLDMQYWHTCETTHCRAGWAIDLCGKKGYELEMRFGPQVAGALIYAKSRPDRATPNFVASNEEAMKDIRECAGVA